MFSSLYPYFYANFHKFPLVEKLLIVVYFCRVVFSKHMGQILSAGERREFLDMVVKNWRD